MKKILILICFILSNFAFSQCTGIESYTITPPPVNGQYSSGTVINVCYQMTGWSGLNFNTNWLEGFEINLSSSLTSPLPQAAPANCNGGSGNWIWIPGTITSSSTGISVGPGWFFETDQGGVIDGNPGNDWGDFGNCTWSFCFSTTVIESCSSDNILIQITAGADGTWGSWGTNSCTPTAFNVFNGTNTPIDFESIAVTPLNQTICIGDNTTHQLSDATNLSLFYPTNPYTITWNTIGVQQVEMIEENINGCLDTTIFTVNVSPLPNITINPIDTLCFNDSPVQMQAFPIGGTWNIGPIFSPQLGTNWIQYTYTDNFGCQNSDTILIVVNQNPNDILILGINNFINCSNVDRNLIYTTTGPTNSTYTWNLNGELQQNNDNNISVNFPNISEFQNELSVYETNEFGCVGNITTITVYSESCGDFYIPNSFSPDFDFVNDVFKVSSISKIDDFEMEIYNRWGELVYKFYDQNEWWDGSNCQNDVYIYKFNGKIGENRIFKIGNINLIR